MKIIKFIKYILDYKKNKNVPFMPLTDDKPIVRCHSETYDIKIFYFEKEYFKRYIESYPASDNMANAKHCIIEGLSIEIAKHIKIIETEKRDKVYFKATIPIGIRRKEEK